MFNYSSGEGAGSDAASSGARQDLNLQIQQTVAGQILLSWDQVAEATAYQVYCSDHPIPTDSPGWDLLADLPQTATCYELSPDTANAYFYMTCEIDAPPVPEGFIYVPAGTFTMGDTQGGGYPWELPTHSVTLNHFYISKYEVTQSEYIAVMGNWDSDPFGSGSFGVGDDYPVYYIPWYAAIKYCNLRSMVEGLTPVYSISWSTNPADWGNVPTSNNSTWNAANCNWSANGYRLPTEAEWEYAARGTTNNPDYLYSGSDDINVVGWYAGNNSPNGTKPVGTKTPNSIGTFDMSGNVHEWCWDWYGSSYYDSSPSNNPTGPASGSYRVERGGYWDEDAFICRVAHRGGNFPFSSPYYAGFRVCRSIP
ncbi:MAG: SUMF1/EgtB/PvdO family nonheme iron enzyme [Candidatus Syntrophosphaera sp.]